MNVIHYHIEMSGGAKIDVGAYSAGEAMMKALQIHRGETVQACSSGNTDRTIKDASHIEYEVPKHDALTIDPEPGQQEICSQYLKEGDSIQVDGCWVKIDKLKVGTSTIEVSNGEWGQRFGKRTILTADISPMRERTIREGECEPKSND